MAKTPAKKPPAPVPPGAPVAPCSTYAGASMVRFVDEAGNLLAGEAPFPDERVAELYRHMVRARRFDARMLKLQRQGRIGTFAPCFGQEAAQVGSIAACTPKDWFVPSFRELACALYRGAPMRNVLLYGMGLEEGSAAPPDARDLPISIPVGGQSSHAVGLAWAMKLRGERAGAIVYFGDGATSEGIVHEAMNFAGVMKLGVVFLCQNNQWAISTPRVHQASDRPLAERAAAYGFPGVVVDGNDLLAVLSVCTEAMERARSGGGATFVECITYRRGVHTTADDPRVYRGEEEEKAWESRDPLDRTRRYLEKRGAWDAARERALEEAVDAEMQVEIQAAEDYRASSVNPLEMFDYVYVSMPPYLKAQRDEAEEAFRGRNVVVGASAPWVPGGAAAVGQLEEAPPEDAAAPKGGAR
ncbi:MAG: pyruvate dehydrogenase (acetyl-transferring) E1 component subunit alpha [Planctomycetaceae bacterium]|nr:pyruvate dehydrogenase (acetyl-transferring) E1 component subunit alpha [Planctomycetota bacterium]NUN51821.1 pyruvate dehydrogenase (acetyl-transferring) E1 component subunit alpha [Planctomycetaceae bacterium]